MNDYKKEESERILEKESSDRKEDDFIHHNFHPFSLDLLLFIRVHVHISYIAPFNYLTHYITIPIKNQPCPQG